MTTGEILGYAALVLLAASYWMHAMTWLRILAIAANVAIVLYGIVAWQVPVIAIGVVLALINAWRLWQLHRLTGVVRDATAGSRAPITMDWLLPYMQPTEVPAGTVLFRKGEVADAMYVLQSGRVTFDELNVEIGKGNLIGEIGIFSDDQQRTATATCLERSSLLKISADKVRELYFQNPEFGFFLIGLITRRLMEDAAKGTLKP